MNKVIFILTMTCFFLFNLYTIVDAFERKKIFLFSCICVIQEFYLYFGLVRIFVSLIHFIAKFSLRKLSIFIPHHTSSLIDDILDYPTTPKVSGVSCYLFLVQP